MVDRISFDTTGFSDPVDTPNQRVWQSPSGDPVTLRFFDVPPGNEADFTDLEATTRNFWHLVAADGMGFVEVSLVNIGAHHGIRQILKMHGPVGGLRYIGCLTLLFMDYNFIITVAADEGQITGLRESLVAARLMEAGVVDMVPLETVSDQQTNIQGRLSPWTTQLVDDSIPEALQPNLSEDAQYDDVVPGHPLSRVRATLSRIVSTIEYASELQSARAYEYRQ